MQKFQIIPNTLNIGMSYIKTCQALILLVRGPSLFPISIQLNPSRTPSTQNQRSQSF